MKKLKRFLALALCIVTLSTVFFGTFSASAANYTSSYSSYNQPESSGDYAYWNGSKVVKSSSTQTDEIKWMQAALNYCISYKGLKASKLDVDGSFGPASKTVTISFQNATNLNPDGKFGPDTIKMMKNVLNGQVALNAAKYLLYWPLPKGKGTNCHNYGNQTRSNGTRWHSGLDISVATGTSVYSVADGVVAMVGGSKTGARGYYIVIYHSQLGISSLYEHLRELPSLKVNTKVTAGQKIAVSGNTGDSTGPHLHYALMYGKMTNTGYDLWTVAGKKYNGKTYTNNTFSPDTTNTNIKYI